MSGKGGLRTAIRLAVGLVAGTVYGYGLFLVGFAGLGAGLNHFFLILAVSPVGIGAYLWPLVGAGLSMSGYRWCRHVVLLLLAGHLLFVLASLVEDPSLVRQFFDLFDVFAVEASLATLFYLGGQLLAWRLWWSSVRGSPRGRAHQAPAGVGH